MQGFLGKLSDKDTAKIGYAMSQQPSGIRRNRNDMRGGEQRGKGGTAEEGNQKGERVK